MDEQNEPRQPINNPASPRLRWTRRWYFWLGLVLLILLSVAGYKYWQLVLKVHLSSREVSQAEAALARGVTIEDKKDDFVIMGKNDEKPNENNPSPYRLPVVDIKSLQMGSDDKYLYFKILFYDKIGKKPPVVESDTIEGLGAKVDFLDKPMGRNLVVLHLDFGWWPILHVPVLNTYYATGPTGIEWPESARFTTENRDSKIFGGTGYDYILAAYPLKTLELKTGDIININLETEAKSAKWDHAAVDVLQGVSKTPGFITWKLGSNTYTINNQGSGDSGEQEVIKDFESCAKLYPVLETYPEQCKTPDGKSYIKK